MTDEPESEAAIATLIEEARDPEKLNRGVIHAAYVGRASLVQRALAKGADVNHIDPETGLCALHIAVGANDLLLCRVLIDECSAAFFPDRFGRWPTLIAAECEVGDELSDYIVEQEARFLKENRSS